MPYLTDRTRILKMQQCPRSRYYHSEINNIGITPSRTSISLSKGLSIHEGVGHLNKQVMAIQQSRDLSVGIDVDAAVEAALNFYRDLVSKAELDLEDNSPHAYVYAEQCALIEFAVRGYAIARLPYHARDYYVLSVEKENLLQLSDDLILMSRKDSIERKVDTNGPYIFEFKTSFAWDSPEAKKKTIEDEYRIDMQGLADLLAMESSLGEEMHGINMEFFINGSRRQDRDRIYKQDTWTIRPWMKRNVVGPDEFAWQYWYKDELGNNRNIGKSFIRVNIWEMMPVKDWIEALANMHVQPELGDPLSKVFIAPVPFYRNSEEIRSWIAATVAQELRVIEALDRINSTSDKQHKQMLLDEYFPKYTHSCINKYRKYCPFYIICHGELNGVEDVRESGLFVDRKPHHDAEIEMVGGDE